MERNDTAQQNEMKPGNPRQPSGDPGNKSDNTRPDQQQVNERIEQCELKRISENYDRELDS
jgi:hypothetical protein